jgi:putative nucleotidyltransferase with HDIG domain
MGAVECYQRTDSKSLFEFLSEVGERITAESEDPLEELQEMAPGLRSLLRLGFIGLRAELSAEKEILVEEGVLDRGTVVEVPIMRGKIRLGALSAGPLEDEELDEQQFRGLKAAASFCALALNTAYAQDLAAVRAAHGSVVQIASEALGNILDEERLYDTVLLLTLELLGASGGVIILENDRVASAGDVEESLEELLKLQRQGKGPWMGQVGGRYFLGAPVGRSGARIFLVREDSPYSDSEGGSLKLAARQLARARERSQLYAEMEKTTLDAIMALAVALESRDGTTGEHIRRTQDLAGEVAEELGLGHENVQHTRYVAVLHDIGKIGIPDAILNKPGKLDEDEWESMRQHPRIGADIITRISGFEEVSAAILAHHERFDGRGYPSGLSGEDIPIEARIISAVDSYDAMTNDRPYRKALSHEEALDELSRNSGSQLDQKVVEVFEQVLSTKREEPEHE